MMKKLSFSIVVLFLFLVSKAYGFTPFTPVATPLDPRALKQLSNIRKLIIIPTTALLITLAMAYFTYGFVKWSSKSTEPGSREKLFWHVGLGILFLFFAVVWPMFVGIILNTLGVSYTHIP